MHRFMIVTGCALQFLAYPVPAAPKPKPQAISACYHTLCLTNLRWMRPDGDVSLSAIEGVFVNDSQATISTIVLRFELTSGRVLANTASAIYQGEIPPGGRWRFSAQFQAFEGRVIVTKSESVVLSGTISAPGKVPGWLSQTVQFDPLFAPIDYNEQKQWEKIHGKRQR